MKIPEYLEAFVRQHFADHQVERVLSEFIDFASDGVGGSKYTRRTVANVLASRERGADAAKLNYYGA